MDEPITIQLNQVTKFYGRRPGVIDLSASIAQGTLVGLLGPNGSGKTTTIRVLTCHTPPTSGRATVCGFDVFSQSLEVRRRLGYLPENCPLYPEMRVFEYLRWTAAMKGLTGSDVERAIFETLDPCGLENVRRQAIGTLSKGYRQRVGLAAALLHRPEVVVLDEPTIGLDPLQVREFRNLIGSLKGKHTVLISSHILSEVEMLCDSVIILTEGRVVASGSPRDLRGHVASIYNVECRADASLLVLLPQMVQRLPGVTLEKYEESEGYARFRLRGEGPDPRVDVFRFLSEARIEIRELTRERVTLEDVFVHYTRAALPRSDDGGPSAKPQPLAASSPLSPLSPSSPPRPPAPGPAPA
ncbi:MAG: ABC transporter ATP-binding protein, partial [Candidatus Sumerlaeota bacterium]|nr:ABC transporter ATP-binding protein [Candidatus Sumerlaeota bacterium]